MLDEDELVDGIDELGVLLYGHDKNAYWYGSQLSLEEARALAPYQNATGLQVTSAVLAGMVWALENPKAGIVEADEMDYRRCLEVQMPYLGPVKGYYTDWTPLDGPPGPVPGGHRHEGPLAVPQRPGALKADLPDVRLQSRKNAWRSTYKIPPPLLRDLEPSSRRIAHGKSTGSIIWLVEPTGTKPNTTAPTAPWCA